MPASAILAVVSAGTAFTAFALPRGCRPMSSTARRDLLQGRDGNAPRVKRRHSAVSQARRGYVHAAGTRPAATASVNQVWLARCDALQRCVVRSLTAHWIHTSSGDARLPPGGGSCAGARRVNVDASWVCRAPQMKTNCCHSAPQLRSRPRYSSRRRSPPGDSGGPALDRSGISEGEHPVWRDRPPRQQQRGRRREPALDV